MFKKSNFLEENCPIRCVLDRIGDRWSLLILELLDNKVLGFNSIYRELGDISKQSLSSTLKKLEKDGYIKKYIYSGYPLRVDYSLSELGLSFLFPLKNLIQWANLNRDKILNFRNTL